ncbi:hypothetical protein AB0K40_09880 [Nonomuraea bangladeshensis]|uniref:Uncharacterized protein n=1 Tax=Nonomuraea bangladeshensis TaxID=404385 RepID=A0ABV3GZT1_9ACTN
MKSVVRRRYETRLAVDRISFTVERGEFLGLLHPYLGQAERAGPHVVTVHQPPA